MLLQAVATFAKRGRMRSAVVVGLAVVDVIHEVEDFPRENSKAVASRQQVFCGGPAANAAVTCASLGASVSLAVAVGRHPATHVIREDLAHFRVVLHDLSPDSDETPSVSSVLVSKGSGARTIISGHATRRQSSAEAFDPSLLNDAGVLMVDGHQSECAIRAAKMAKQSGIPVVLDGGSWKPTSAELLAFTDYAVCSENFYPPGTKTPEDVVANLLARGVEHAAITRGGNSVLWATKADRGEITVPAMAAVDTTGAGDVFHGAFCQQLLRGTSFQDALVFAAKVASFSCQYFGTREWMTAWTDGHY